MDFFLFYSIVLYHLLYYTFIVTIGTIQFQTKKRFSISVYHHFFLVTSNGFYLFFFGKEKKTSTCFIIVVKHYCGFPKKKIVIVDYVIWFLLDSNSM